MPEFFALFSREKKAPRTKNPQDQPPSARPHLELTPEDQARLAAINKELAQQEAIVKDQAQLNTLSLDQLQELQAQNATLNQTKRALEAKERGFTPLSENIETARQELESRLNSRFQEFGSNQQFSLSAPEAPENLTPEHLAALEPLFGQGNLELMTLPKIEELHHLDEEYQKVMYPTSQTEEDQKRGLTSFRPDWWDKLIRQYITDWPSDTETCGQAYLSSMRLELTQLGGSVVLVESLQKPNYTDGSQHYGTVAGTDVAKDSLLSLIREVFAQDANRFNHDWDESQTKLIPKVKEKIKDLFLKQGLPLPDFEVQLCPASLFNLATTLFHPQNSTTSTWEWTSTILRNHQNQDSGRRLRVGDSGGGGAAGVGHARRGGHGDGGSLRLAVVFKKP